MNPTAGPGGRPPGAPRDAIRSGRPADRRRWHGSAELRVNPIACEAHGLCTELLPELITADPWGYPITAPDPVPRDLIPLARRAVALCPTRPQRMRAAGYARLGLAVPA